MKNEKKLRPTRRSLKTLGSNTYLLDYSKIYTFSVTEPMTLLSTDGIVPRMPIEGIGLR